MKIQNLAAAMAALSISVCSAGTTSVHAQNSEIIPNQKAGQNTDQSGSAVQSDGNMPKAGATSGASGDSGSSTGTKGSANQGGSSMGANSDQQSGSDTASPKTATPQSNDSNSAGSDSGSADQGTVVPKSKQLKKQQPDSQSKTTSATKGGDQKPAAKTAPSNDGQNQKNTTSGTAGDNSSKSSTQNNTQVQVSVEQQTRIRDVVKTVHVEPIRETDFSVAVGTRIPRKIRLEPLPPRIVEIVPQYRTYRFFILADGRIVIVDPSTFAIVYIIAA